MGRLAQKVELAELVGHARQGDGDRFADRVLPWPAPIGWSGWNVSA